MNNTLFESETQTETDVANGVIAVTIFHVASVENTQIGR